MPDYSQAKIYCIKSPKTSEVYYGSTCCSLKHRLGQHGSNNNTTSKRITQYGDAYIELVEEFPCADKLELHIRERFYIENNPCINKQTPGRTRQEIIDNDNEKRKALKKAWYVANRDRILAKLKALKTTGQ